MVSRQGRVEVVRFPVGGGEPAVVVGGLLAEKLGIQVVPDFWGQLITASAGAVVVLFIWQAIKSA